jgi:Holliday junction DNA helicase RuvA
VGPKSAFHLVSQISVDEIIQAIQSDQKKVLTRVTGVGAKAASQMVLDLQKKIPKVKMYSNESLRPLRETLLTDAASKATDPPKSEQEGSQEKNNREYIEPSISQSILDDTILACKNLGFQSEHIIPLAQKILKENQIKKTEQLVHLVLKEV